MPSFTVRSTLFITWVLTLAALLATSSRLTATTTLVGLIVVGLGPLLVLLALARQPVLAPVVPRRRSRP